MESPEIRMTRLITSSQISGFNKAIPIRFYFRSGREILRMANIYKDEGDDEKAFQLFLRYMELFLQKMVEHPEYKEYNQAEREQAKAQCKKLFPITEELKAHIRKKYEYEYRKFLEQEEEKRRMNENVKQREAEYRQKEEARRQQEQKEDLERRMKEAKDRNLLGINMLSIDDSNDQNYTGKLVANSITNGPSAPRSSPVPSFDFDETRPRVDRTTKPSNDGLSFGTEYDGDELRKVVIPLDLKDRFLDVAKSNTSRNVETGGILAGKLSKNEFTITTVIIPKQEGCSDSFSTLKEEEIFDYQIEHDLITLGWIHTHPSQSAFMSSIDLHTHCSYQILLPEAIAIVVAPSYDETKIFSLTPDVGLPIISTCPKKGFHPHPNDSTLYCTCSHVTFEDSRRLKTILIDLRN